MSEDRRPPGLGRSAARGTAVTLLAQGTRSALQVASLVVMARLLTPEDYGLVAMVSGIIGVADIVRDFGLSLATMRAPSLSRDERTNLFWANLALGVACTVVAMALTPLIVALYDEPRLTPIVLTMALAFTLSGFTTQFRAGLARELRFKALAGVDVSAQAVSLVVGVGLALSGAGLWAIVAQQLGNALFTALAMSRLARWWPGLPKRGVSIRGFVTFGGGVLGTQVVGFLTKNVDTIAVGAALGARSLGFYDRAYQMMMLPLRNLNAPLTQVAVPVLAKVQHDDRQFQSYLLRAQVVGCYVTATLFAVTTALADPVVAVLFGPRWSGAAPVLAVLALGGMFRATGQVAYWGYLARGASGALFRQLLVTGAISITLMLGGLAWGTVGVAAGHSLGAAVAWAGALWHLGRVTGIDTRPLMVNSARALALVALPCGLAASLATLLDVAPLLQVVVGLALAGVVVALSATIGPVRRDLTVVVGFARSALRRGPRGAAAPAVAPAVEPAD